MHGNTGSARPFDFNFDGIMDVIAGYKYCADNLSCNIFQLTKIYDSRLVLFTGKGDGTFEESVSVHETLGSLEASRFSAPMRICPWYFP